MNPSPSTPDDEFSRVSDPAALHKGCHSRGYLPHFDVAGMTQGLTFRLADAVPLEIIDKWKRDLQWIDTPSSKDEGIHAEQRAALHKLLARFEDSGCGECFLAQAPIAQIVVNALLHFNTTRYDLKAWCVMPNHVHVLLRPQVGSPLGGIVQSLKRYTARQSNIALSRRGSFWAADYYDRYIRDESHFHRAVHYIHQNPVKAHLCASAEDWPWSSAHPNGARI
jgi:REP element-mobilizing transposase RayT